MIDMLELVVEIIVTIIGVTISDAVSHALRQKFSARRGREGKAVS
ncbi:MAG: hypothetical protein QXF24_06940 [Thermoproteota archaeon]